jgi:hypothetical protein
VGPEGQPKCWLGEWWEPQDEQQVVPDDSFPFLYVDAIITKSQKERQEPKGKRQSIHASQYKDWFTILASTAGNWECESAVFLHSGLLGIEATSCLFYLPP